MGGLNPKYMLAPSLQELFVDKDTGLPLSNGIVTFYKDGTTTELKDIFKLSGSPPDYGYVALPNPCRLSGIGSFQDDDGNDILPYYYPYDELGKIELYYITVESEGNVPQFTRSGFPNFTQSSNTTLEETINFIPNGQFLLHNDIPADILTDKVAGEVRAGNTIIAQGGWSFDRPDASTAKDILTFPPFGSYTTNPNFSPQFYVNVETQSVGIGDGFKDIRVKFTDVNKFSSDTDKYTVAFYAKAGDSQSFNVKLYRIKYFGIGGSTTDEVLINTFTINDEWDLYQVAFSFGSNDAFTETTDTYVQLALRLPLGSVFAAGFTDCVLTVNDFVLDQFPPQTNDDMVVRSLAAPTPDPSGMDLGLLLKLTKNGLAYDNSIVGKIFFSPFAAADDGELLMDGSQYLTEGYSDEGIPYLRIQQRLYGKAGTNLPLWGTGDSFSTSFISAGVTNLIILTNNSAGPVTNSADHGTTFTVSNIHTGLATNWKTYSIISTSEFLSKTMTVGDAEGSAGNSGFTYVPGRHDAAYYSDYAIITTVPTTLASKYWYLVLGAQYMWFKVDGAGTDPTPGGTGTEVDLLSTYTAADVCKIVQSAAQGGQISTITTVAASAVTAGTYWTFTSISPASTLTNYYVWYTKDGLGTDPVVASAIGIKVDLLSADTAVQVATKTQSEINSKYFKIDNWQGLFIRGYDPNSQWDINDARFSSVAGYFGQNIGTLQLSNNQEHVHGLSSGASHTNVYGWTANGEVELEGGSLHGIPNLTSAVSLTGTLTGTTDVQGGPEVVPINVAVNYVIKY